MERVVSSELLIGLIVIGLVGSAFFSGAEIAIITCNRLQIHHLALDGNRAALAVERCLHNLRRMVTTTLLGTNFFNVAAASAATGLFAMLVPGNEALLSTLIITPLVLVFAEIYPKTIFQHHADGVCLKIAPFLNLVQMLLLPLVWLADRVISLLLRAMGSRDTGRGTSVTREEIKSLLGEGRRLGILRFEGWQMIHRTFGFSGTSVEAIMVPLVDVYALAESKMIMDGLEEIAEHGHSRIPVYRDRVDNIVGLLYVFDLLNASEGATVGDLMRPAYYVPETKRLQQLILEMKQCRVHQAVIVDEFGGASGIVTLEDALERIVGEIRDEFDRSTAPIPQDREEWTTLSARTPLDDLQRSLGTELPEGEYKTVGGYLTSELGRIPEAGELHAIGDLEFEVLEATPRKVLRVRIRCRRKP